MPRIRSHRSVFSLRLFFACRRFFFFFPFSAASGNKSTMRGDRRSWIETEREEGIERWLSLSLSPWFYAGEANQICQQCKHLGFVAGKLCWLSTVWKLNLKWIFWKRISENKNKQYYQLDIILNRCDIQYSITTKCNRTSIKLILIFIIILAC